jgi:N-glycosylase/DNA lyase
VEELVKDLKRLKNSGIRQTIDSRLRSFRAVGRNGGDAVFSELCFCICTANNSAERGLRAQAEVDFCGLTEPHLRKKMKEVVCRFYNHKTDYVLEARTKKDEILTKVASFKSGKDAREWVAKNVKGLGFKEASHFLRNIGFCDVAIIDFHIIDLLARRGIIRRPKSLTRKAYLDIEKKIEALSEKAGMDLAELDLYLWYMETGKVLK